MKPHAEASMSPTENLLSAAREGDVVKVSTALNEGANIEGRDVQGRTPLLLTALHDHVGLAKLLVEKGADPDALDNHHDTPWLVTGVTGSVEMLETLLPANPDLTIENRFGGVSVIPAAKRGHVEYVRRVVQTNIDLNHVNICGWTALMEAVLLGDGGVEHQEILRILVAAGADRSIPDLAGVTALERARRRNWTAMVEILEG